MLKIIVTGGSGFIGGHLVDQLIAKGHQVIVADNESASDSDLFHCNEKAQYHKVDICDKEKLDQLFQGIDYVFHMAAESRIQPAILNPSRAYLINAIGTLNVLELAKKHKVKRVIYSSTSSVYGLTNSLPTQEDSPIDCLNPYSHSKFFGEELFRYYWKIHGVDSVIFRYFNVFGERSPTKGQYAPVVGIFLNQLKSHQKLTIVGDGNKKRDFIHVSDVIDANVSAMEYSSDLRATTINIGSGKSISILELAQAISNDYINIESREGEAENTLADISKAEKLLGFKPKVDIVDWINAQKS